MPDRRTLAAYDAGAELWAHHRPPSPALTRLASWVDRAAGVGPRADLGCGTGAYLGALGEPVVALDAAAGMLHRVRSARPGVPAVRADLAALPLRRGALAGAWARASYLHVPPAWLPLALARLHDALRPGAPFAGTMKEGRPGWRPLPDDELPGRRFAFWHPDAFAEVLRGAGFEVLDLCSADGWITFRARRGATLPDYAAPGLRLLVVGYNPSPPAAATGVPFAGRSNRFWAAAVRAGLVPPGRDPWAALRSGVGFCDLVKRPTARAATLTRRELRAGLERVERLVRRVEPGAVCLAGVGAGRALLGARGPGPSPRPVGGRPTWVMPNPSGANPAATLPAITEHLRAAVAHGAGDPLSV